jgi:hypothetical protein
VNPPRFIAQWWRRKPTRAKWALLLKVVPAVLGTLVAVFNLSHLFIQWRHEESPPQFSHVSGKLMDFAKLPKQFFDDITKAKYDAATTVVIDNHESSKPLKSLNVFVPREGHVVVTEQASNTVLNAGVYPRRLHLDSVLPFCTYAVLILHNEPVKPDETIAVSTEETGKQVLPSLDSKDFVSFWYKDAFYACLALLISSLFWVVVDQWTGQPIASTPPVTNDFLVVPQYVPPTEAPASK